MKNFFCIAFWLFFAFGLSAQSVVTPGTERLDKSGKHIPGSLVENMPVTNIGPTVMSGRVSDIAVSPSDPTHFYVAYASGGLWETRNNGTSFTPLFDGEAAMTIGAIAVDWKSKTLWVGTGEVNSSRSSYAGTGVYKSTNGGKSWQYMGLPESHHIGRIVIHPTDPNKVWVAVLGHLYSHNPERGVYQTTDGGKTWKQSLQIDNKTGAVDLLLDPASANTLYAATWERERSAWNFVESGKGSGIYKSTDGGKSWKKINGANSGFPDGSGTGRIGLAATVYKGKTVLFACLDNQNGRPDTSGTQNRITKNKIKETDKTTFLALDTALLSSFLKDNDFPAEYTTERVRKMVESDSIEPVALVEYLEDANSLLFDTPVIGQEIYRSDNGGVSWKKTHAGYLDDLVYSYGYYFGQVRVAAGNPNKIYTFGVPVIRSDDGGKTFTNINGDNVHVDHHALWVNPAREGHLILGNDGGVNISYDDGATWIKCNTPPVGQFYAIQVDMAKPFNVYGGLQDNGVWYAPHTYTQSVNWHNTGVYPYKGIMGGDGMQVAVDTRTNSLVYTGYQFGNYFRINTASGQRQYITPSHKLGERPYRWNWQTPIQVSSHNQDIVYMGANKLFRSFDKGDHFAPISSDLTNGGKKGDVPFGTLTTIHESSLRFGLLYTGSDDGLIHVSKDGGTTWQRISDALPKDMWVSRVQASLHKESRVFATLNGYRQDHFVPYVFVSDDCGQTWTSVSGNLPLEPVNVVREDPVNPHVLYVGTDHGVYITVEFGAQERRGSASSGQEKRDLQERRGSASSGQAEIAYMRLGKDLPRVAVHDLVVHPRDGQLIIGTHGRSLYKADIRPLQQVLPDSLDKDVIVMDPGSIRFSSNWGSTPAYETAKPVETSLSVYSANTGTATLRVETREKNIVLSTQTALLQKGLNYPALSLVISPEQVEAFKEAFPKTELKKADDGRYYLPKGKYKLVVEKGGTAREKVLVVE